MIRTLDLPVSGPASSTAGATTTSMKPAAAMAAEVPASRGRLTAITLPKAESGSASQASRKAVSRSPASATPHAFMCFTTTQAGRSNS